MRRLALLFAGFAVLVTGIVFASFASTTKAETRSALSHVGTLAWRLAVAALVFALSLTPAGCLTESNGERDGHGAGYPYYSRDGVSVAFTSDRSGTRDIYVARVGGAAERITDTDHGVGALAWSSDGSRIVFSGLTGEEFPDRTIGGLFVVNRDGSGLRQITSGEDYWPCWAAAGNTIVFVRGDHIRAVNSDGTGGRRLVRNADMPACSPTESVVAFVVKTMGGWGGVEIGVLDLRSGSRRVLPGPTDATDYASPSWSPDGSRIVFEAQRRRKSSDPVVEEEPAWAAIPWYFAELYVLDADGAGLTQLTQNAVGDRWPDWLPDGRIFFLSNRAGPDDLTNSETSRAFLMSADGTGVEPFPWDPRYS